MCKQLSLKDTQQLQLDDYSKLTITYTKDGFDELQKDIEAKGQLVPIILREGKILDGRHRHQACVELDMGIKYTELGSISDAEALEVVVSNSINKSTDTDPAKVEAYLISKAKGLANKDIPKLFTRLNRHITDKLSFIYKENPEYLQVILRQGKVRLYNVHYNKVEDYGTIHSLWSTLKSNKKLEGTVIEIESVLTEDVQYEIDVCNYFNDSKKEEVYWKFYNEIGSSVTPGTTAGNNLMQLIKRCNQ